MKTPFLNRTEYNPRTMTYSFADGSGVMPEEMRQDLLCAQLKKTIADTNGIPVLATLFGWKDRLQEQKGRAGKKHNPQ